MSSAINRRFLDVSLTVQGVVNELPAGLEPKNGMQYIVGANPVQGWTGATANAIARYDAYAKAWKFTKPALGQIEVLNKATNQILAWDGEAWSTVADLNGSGGAAGEGIEKFVKAMVYSGTTLPTSVEKGAKFLNTEDGKLYTATNNDEWNAGVALVDGDRYVSYTDKKIYEMKGTELTGAKPADGVIFLSLGDNIVFGYDATRDVLVCVPGGDIGAIKPDEPLPPTPPIPKPAVEITYTENHTLTVEEAAAKSFNLSRDVVSGREANVLLIVCGMPQVAVADYTVSGKVVSWTDGQGLGQIGMEAGDVFTVTYPTMVQAD